MENNEEILLTPEGYELKKKKLEEYKKILYEEIPKRLKQATLHGGELRENKEYLDVKRDQEFYDTEVRRLQELLEKAEIIDEKSISAKFIGIGSHVLLKDIKRGETETFQLVSPVETDLEHGKISIESPLGKALIGRKRGEEITVETPSGVTKYRILGIQKK